MPRDSSYAQGQLRRKMIHQPRCHVFPGFRCNRESGDQLSEQFVRYDIADETQHVRFGKRWLPELLKHVNEQRSLEQYTAEVLKVWEDEYRTGKLTINVE